MLTNQQPHTCQPKQALSKPSQHHSKRQLFRMGPLATDQVGSTVAMGTPFRTNLEKQ
jgi:hypothetical protein